MIDLDKEKCVLCEYNIPVLNIFLNSTFDDLVGKCTIDQLYHEMEKALKNNNAILASQGIKTPNITASELKKHFTEHQLVLSHNLASDANDIRKMQQTLLSKKLSPVSMKLYLQLSTKKLDLITRLEELRTGSTKIQPYAFD